jgi:hypothetical protein
LLGTSCDKEKIENDSNEARLNNNISDLNPDEIYSKIAPYLSNPESIKNFLFKHSKLTKNELIRLIEKELLTCQPNMLTDLRILLNSL